MSTAPGGCVDLGGILGPGMTAALDVLSAAGIGAQAADAPVTWFRDAALAVAVVNLLFLVCAWALARRGRRAGGEVAPLLTILERFLVVLVVEYVARWIAYRQPWGEVLLLLVQSGTGLLFTVFVFQAAAFVVDRMWGPGRGERMTLGRAVRIGRRVGLTAAVATPAFVLVGLARADEPLQWSPGTAETVLASLGPAVSMVAFGFVLWRVFAARRSRLGQAFSVGPVLYGLIQLSEIGERLLWGEASWFSFAILLLALLLRAIVAGSVVVLCLSQSALDALENLRVGLLFATGQPAADVGLTALWANAQARELLGVDAGAVEGRRLAELLDPDWPPFDADAADRDFTDVLTASVPRRDGHPTRTVGEPLRLTTSRLKAPSPRDEAEQHVVFLRRLGSATHTHTEILLRDFAHAFGTPIETMISDLESCLAMPERVDAGRLRELLSKAQRLERAWLLQRQVGRNLAGVKDRPECVDVGAVVAALREDYDRLPADVLAEIVRTAHAKIERVRAAAVDGHGATGSSIDVRALGDGQPRGTMNRAALEVMLTELLDNALRRCQRSPPRVEWSAERIVVRNDVTGDRDQRDELRAGLTRRGSQGLECVRLIALQEGIGFDIAIDDTTGECVATLTLSSTAVPTVVGATTNGRGGVGA